MRDRPRGAAAPGSLGWLPPAVRALVWGLTYWSAGQIGLHTVMHDKPLALVAPSAGVAIVWFAFSSRRSMPFDVLALSVFAMALSYQLGLPPALVAFGVCVSLSQVGVFLFVMRRFAGDLSPFGSVREQWRLSDLGVFLAAAVSAALAVAVLATGSQWVAGLSTGDLPTFLTRWGRSSATIVAVGSVGLLVGPGLRRAWREHRLGPWLRERVTAPPARRIEMGVMTTASVLLYLLCFFALEDLPLTFVLFVVTAWVGIRCSPAFAATYSLLGGAIGVIATLEGRGIFAVVIEDPAQRAVVAQLFVLATSATGLALAIARSQMVTAEALAESRLQMLDQVLSEVRDGIMLVEADGTVPMINQAGKDLFDIDVGEDLTHVRPVASFALFESDGSRVLEDRVPFRRALRGETVAGEELELRRPDGRVKRYLRFNAEVLPALQSGLPPRVLVTYHDVTGDRLRQDALATFAGHVAHDLRNPLSVVEAWNEVLADAFTAGDVPPATGLPMTAKVGAASARMRDFIQGLLDYTLARDRTLSPEPVDLAALAADVAELREQSTGRSTSPSDAPHIQVLGAGVAMADHELVRIVIDNLVANACKYVAPGVRPRVTVLVEQTDPLTVSLSVVDNGIGIPADQRARIFESYHRVERGGRFEGSGLGLGICQRIVERHGGTITVEDVAEGASLRVTLPSAVAVLDQPELPPELVAG